MTKQLGRAEPLALSGATSLVQPGNYHSPIRIAIEGLFRQKWVFLGLVFLVLGAALAVTLLKHKQFKSEMQLLLQGSRTNAVISADRSAPTPVQDVTEQQINSEIEVLQSEDVVGSVVDPQWNLAPQGTRSKAEVEAHESKIADFQKHLTVEASNKSNVITVTFKAGTPELASSMLNKLAVAYLAHRREINRPKGTSAFFAEETKRYKDVWDKASADMVDFQRQNGLVSVPDVEEALDQQIITTQNELRAAQTSLGESEQRVEASARLAAQVPERQPTQQRLSPNQGAIQQIQSVLLQLRNRRTELLTRFQPTDRLVTEIDKQIADSTQALARVEQARDKDDTTDVNPAWQQVRTGEVQAIVDKRAAQSRIASLQGDLAGLQAKLSQIQPLSLKFNELQERVDQARNNFEIFSQKRDQSNIEDSMDEHRLVNVAVVENPTISYQQIAPRPVLYMFLGTITALFLASSAAYLMESLRSTIATRRELALVSRYPVLATVPHEPEAVDIGTDGLLAPTISAEQGSLGRAGRTLIPVIQNIDEARET